jgi:monovalent cation:proton antiporter-2 (CPA2) family protein
MNELFFQAFVYLTAAVISVPIAKRLGLGSVLGYLVAGVAIGPFGLGLVGEEGEDVMHFAEFGVVMMLFLVGLELEPALLWRLRIPILGLGGAQVFTTALLGALVGVGAGLGWKAALAIGLTLALSSTAIVLQTLAEKGLMKTAAGQSSFAVLLFQDIAVIPMLAIFPLLATHHGTHGDGHHGSAVGELPAWLQTLAVLGAVLAIVGLGRTVLRHALRAIARTRLRELFVGAALLLIIGIALLMDTVGLSPALGTFIAGVVLANSEYRHALEADIEPFKGLLLGLFFIAVGASIDFRVLVAQPGTIAALVAVLMVGKLLVLFVLGRVFRLGLDQNLLFSFALAQGGEFAFVLFSFGQQSGVLTAEEVAPLVVVVAISMAATPLLLLFFERVLQPRVGTLEKEARPYDAMDDEDPEVIVAGYGRFGQVCTRLLDMQGVRYVVLEYDSDQVELLRRFGREVYYGDATRHDLLDAAGAAKAKLLLITMDRPQSVLSLVRTAREHFPHLQILARAYDRRDAYDLVELGVEGVQRETFESALRLGVETLRALGHRAYRVHRAAQRFRRRDEELLRELAARRSQVDDFIVEARRRNAEVAAVLQQDLEEEWEASDEGWDNSSLRAEGGAR